MDFPTVSECRLLPSSVNRSLLYPLPDGMTILPSLASPYLLATINDQRIALGVTKDNFLAGFTSTAPNARAVLLCVKTSAFGFKVFRQGIDSHEDIEAFLAPPLTEEDIADLPRFVPGAGNRWMIMQPRKPEPKLIGGFCLMKGI